MVNVWQGELSLLRWVETSGAMPQPSKNSCDQQQDDQEAAQDEGLHRWDAAWIHKDKRWNLKTQKTATWQEVALKL